LKSVGWLRQLDIWDSFFGVRDQVRTPDRVAKMQNLSKLIKAAQDFTLNKSTHCAVRCTPREIRGKPPALGWKMAVEIACDNCKMQMGLRKCANMFKR